MTTIITDDPSHKGLNTLQALVSTFCDFLTVAIHTILFERDIYPATSFISVRKYNFAVRQNRHPKVCQWIQDAVTAIETEILNGTVERVALVIHSAEDKPLERFMFDISKFPHIPTGEISTPFEDFLSEPSLVDLSEQLRATMSRLTARASSLKPLPTGCSFIICVELKDNSDAPLGHAEPWIPAQPLLQARASDVTSIYSEKRRDSELGGAKVVPVRALEAGELVFEVWIEEGKEKFTYRDAKSDKTKIIP